MKSLHLFITTAIIASTAFGCCHAPVVSDGSVKDAFAGHEGAFVIIDCASGDESDFGASSEKLPPCSTFKIWNSLAGLETGIIYSPDEAFYKWDGVKRSIADWNRDLTFKEAFRVSCVPAFQELARKIGRDRMQEWIDKIGYGDRDISAGIDVFWLPAKDRKTILISPEEQACLISRLVTGRLPVTEKSKNVIREIMLVRKTDRGILYGKTGSGADESGKYNLGWFVGYVESGGKTYAFACFGRGENFMGKDARTIVEKVLTGSKLL